MNEEARLALAEAIAEYIRVHYGNVGGGKRRHIMRADPSSWRALCGVVCDDRHADPDGGPLCPKCRKLREELEDA